MKKLNQKSAKIFNQLIKLMGEEDHLRINNNSEDSGIMPLVIEKLYQTDLLGRSATIYSLAHYYEQNGDLVPDPDMEFAVSDVDNMYIWPMTFQNGYGSRRGIYKNSEGSWLLNSREQADQASFANMWLDNIKWQQLKPVGEPALN